MRIDSRLKPLEDRRGTFKIVVEAPSTGKVFNEAPTYSQSEKVLLTQKGKRVLTINFDLPQLALV